MKWSEKDDGNEIGEKDDGKRSGGEEDDGMRWRRKG